MTRMRLIVSGLLFVLVPLAASAQEDNQLSQNAKPVDQTKLLLGELYRLGDPEINRMLPDLYWALKATEPPLPENTQSKPSSLAMPNVMAMLGNEGVRRELEMLDYQYEEVQQKYDDILKSMNKRIRDVLDDRDDTSPRELRDRIGAIRADAEKEAEQALLPFQFERLKQLRFHVLMHRMGAYNVLTRDPLASELGITDDQKHELREAAQEINAELAREMAKLRVAAMRKLFARLTREQQAKLEKILGDDFYFEDTLAKTKGTPKGRPKKTEP